MEWIISIVGGFIGALIAICFTIWMESIRKPRLMLKIENPPVDVSYQNNRPARSARYLRLIVENKELPRYAKWLSRNAAIRCYGYINFRNLDWQDVFGRTMRARWVGSPEPVPIQAFAPGPVPIRIFDPVRLSPELNTDIYTGSPAIMDVAVRFDEDAECYGWCNENYFSEPVWRNPDWRLNPGQYLVKAEVVCAGGRCVGLFRLINDVPINAFQLENAQADDYGKVLHSIKTAVRGLKGAEPL